MTTNVNTTEANALEIVKNTRKYFTDPSKWDKGHYHQYRDDGSECYCLMGRIYQEARWKDRIPNEFTPEVPIIVQWLHDEFDDPSLAVIEWNDNPATTHADILDILDRVIAKKEKE